MVAKIFNSFLIKITFRINNVELILNFLNFTHGLASMEEKVKFKTFKIKN